MNMPYWRQSRSLNNVHHSKFKIMLTNDTPYYLIDARHFSIHPVFALCCFGQLVCVCAASWARTNRESIVSWFWHFSHTYTNNWYGKMWITKWRWVRRVKCTDRTTTIAHSNCSNARGIYAWLRSIATASKAIHTYVSWFEFECDLDNLTRQTKRLYWRCVATRVMFN